MKSSLLDTHFRTCFHGPLLCFSPTADSDGVSAQIGSGVVWRVPREFCESSAKVRGGLREGSARFMGRFQGGFQEGSARVLEGVALLGISPELIFTIVRFLVHVPRKQTFKRSVRILFPERQLSWLARACNRSGAVSSTKAHTPGRASLIAFGTKFKSGIHVHDKLLVAFLPARCRARLQPPAVIWGFAVVEEQRCSSRCAGRLPVSARKVSRWACRSVYPSKQKLAFQ